MTSAPREGDTGRGRDEITQVRRETRPLLVAAVLFSIFVNLLMLTGPLYMLQVYDRVLGSRSEATLVALSVLVIFLFLAMGLLIMPARAFWPGSVRAFRRGWTGGSLPQPCRARRPIRAIRWPDRRSAIWNPFSVSGPRPCRRR